MTDIVQIGFSVDTSQIATGQKRMEKLGSTAEKTASKTTAALGGMGRTAGQAGIQIQQLVGQIQMGTSPMVALSQQAADLGFVLGVPLLGAIAGIAASFGSVLLPTLFESDDAVKKLKDTMESLDKVATQTAGGTYTLSAEIARLAKVSETAANAQIALSITEATQAINMARDSANDAIESFDDLFNGFDVVSTPETLNKLNEAMVRTGKSAVDLLNNTNLYATGLTQLKSFSDSLSGSLGTTTEDSIKLIKAVSDFRQGGSISQLAETFSNISLSTNGATKEFQALAVNLNNLSLTTEKSEAVLELLKNTLGDLSEIMANSDSVVNEVINSYRMKTDALSADETQMAKNIAIQTIGINATEEEKEAVLQAVDAYYQKLNAIKEEANAQKKSADEAKKKAKAELDAAKSYQDQINALKSLAEQLVLTADEQMVYQQIQKSLARGDTPEQTAEIERQTRAYIEQRNALKLASDSKKDYDKWIDSISTTSTRMAELRSEIEKTQTAVDSGKLSSSIGAEHIADLEKQIKALDVNPFQSMTEGAQDALQAMSGMFENGSKDAKKLAIAMQALNLVQAVGAVLNQGSGDPYTAFGRMAAMAAMVASLGMSIGGLAGDFEDKSAARQASQNVNQWGDKSESILDATESTANATEKLVGINTDMLSALKNLSMALSSASGIIAKGINTPTASPSIIGDVLDLGNYNSALGKITDFATRVLDPTGLIGGLIGAVGGWLGGSSNVADEGIRIIGGQISDLIENVTVQAFQEVDYKKWKFGKTKSTTAITNLSNEVGNQFSLVFESLADTVATGAAMLGISTDDIERVINNFVIDTSSISLKGLSSDDQIKEIEAYFSNVFNNLSSTVIPFLSDFQKAGEELGETLSRLSSQASIGQYLVKNFGLELGSTSNVIWEGTGIWSGLKVEVLGVASQFVLATNAISEMVGGVDEFASKVSSFTNNFADDSKKLEIYGNAVSSALEDVGLSLPSSARGFYDLFTSINASTAAGQEQVAALLNITETASAYYDMLEDINNEMLSKELSYLGGEIANITSRISDLSVGYRSAAESLYDIGFAAESVSLDAALAAARLGDLDLASSLDLSALAPERSDFASLVDYNIARAETAAKLTELQNIQDNTVDVNERQLSVLEQIRDALSDTSEISNVAEITAELASLREQSYMQTELTNDLLRRLAYTRPEAVQ